MTQEPDVIQQAKDYCTHQASKGIESLVALMERTGADWQHCLDGMTVEQAEFAPGSEWSAHAVVEHYLSVTDGVNNQIRAFTQGDMPDTTEEEDLVVDIELPNMDTPENMQTAVVIVFDDIVNLTRSLEGNEHLAKTFPHPMFGQLNILEWIAFQRLHGQDHIRQIDKNKDDPAYPAA